VAISPAIAAKVVVPAERGPDRGFVDKISRSNGGSSFAAVPDLRRVYYTGQKAARLLQGESSRWAIAPLPKGIDKKTFASAVVIGDGLAVFADDLREAIETNQARLIYLLDSELDLPAEASGVPVFSFLTDSVLDASLHRVVDAAFESLSFAQRQTKLEDEVRRARSEIDQLNETGIALSTQRDRESLLNLILQKSREITQSDAGSLYLIEESSQGARQLRFKITQNDSVQFSFRESILSIDSSSIAGYVALTGEEVHLADVYQIPTPFPFSYNRKFDEETGYRCKSMLAVAMKNPQGEITGVVQLINCKRAAALRVERRTVDDVVIPYPEQCRPLLRSLASQAAVALENIRLYESIETLFEGFVRASVSAIEARDPATSGHSFRVADLTLGLAQVVDRDDSSHFRDIHFSRTEMKEIRYASLLHDFGKVGVREEVLIKAKKLYPMQLDLVKQRFAYARKALEHEQSERKLAYLLQKGREDFLARQPKFQSELEEQLRELDEFLDFVMRCNEPTVLREGNFERLSEFAARQFVDSRDQRTPLLTPQEVKLLSISRGNLDERERRQIESHVNHTLSFLRQIPWTREIKNIPAIASAHHEKLNGTGYPYNLPASEIPFQSKMMTISDIYDALSATDRPYKKAVRSDQALDILFNEAKQGLVDPELLRLFHEAEIYRLTATWKPN
jgi:HD-GYP domain-containing protein (c-di-GMP phosphodiesterase class II)